MLTLKCPQCGHAAAKIEFRFLSHAHSAGGDTYRQCPECHGPVYCEEAEDSEDYAKGTTWGTSSLRGRTFTRENRPKPVSKSGAADGTPQGDENA